MTDTAVLWHAGCPDGWTAAWVAHRALKARYVEPDLIPVTHGQDPPDLDGYRNVYIVDFAYPHDVLVEMAEGRDLIVLDHHRTAIDNIAAARTPEKAEAGPVDELTLDKRPYLAVLDVNRSGAGITWDFFHGERGSALVDYVEDRDLGRFWQTDSKAINAYIHSQELGSLEAWDQLSSEIASNKTREVAAERGRGALAYLDAYCRATATMRAFWVDMGGRVFPMANVTYHGASDVAGYLLDHFDTNMAGYFFTQPDGSTKYGFRSRGGVDVEEFVKQFGGGGHPQAAGCQTDEPVHTIIRGGTEEAPNA